MSKYLSVVQGALPGGLVRNPLRHALPNVTAVGAGQPTSDIVDVATVANPHSTNDTLVDTAELTGGASAIAAAARKNLRAAEAVSSTGDMLSGRVLNAVGLDTQGKPLQQQADGEK